jgi:succinate dehydrogenase/fumarate reductase flavoprotein subunit
MAGREAARSALRQEFRPIDYRYVEKEMRQVELILEGENLYNVNAMRKSLGEKLFAAAGVFRSDDSVDDALAVLKDALIPTP